MRTISVVGIGSGDPGHLTVQAVDELNAADVVFMMDKGEDRHELIDARKQICDRYITGGTRIVTADRPLGLPGDDSAARPRYRHQGRVQRRHLRQRSARYWRCRH